MIGASSNNLLADRRFAWAMALVAEDDLLGATDLLEQVVALVPLWAPGWSALGDARDRFGEGEGARLAWTRAAALDPDDRLGAGLKLSRLSGKAPAAMTAAYVAALFDDYAPRFDRHLVEGLHYRGPEVLAATLAKAAPGQVYARALDLGCGTGLMARALQGTAGRIDGIDLSPAMVTEARRTGLYTELAVASIEDGLAETPDAAYDLVTAADVLVYLGELGHVFRGSYRVLTAGGFLAFTTQALMPPLSAARGFDLGPDLRFAHAPDYVAATLGVAGLKIVSLEAGSTRSEKGVAVPGLIVIARRP